MNGSNVKRCQMIIRVTIVKEHDGEINFWTNSSKPVSLIKYSFLIDKLLFHQRKKKCRDSPWIRKSLSFTAFPNSGPKTISSYSKFNTAIGESYFPP